MSPICTRLKAEAIHKEKRRRPETIFPDGLFCSPFVQGPVYYNSQDLLVIQPDRAHHISKNRIVPVSVLLGRDGRDEEQIAASK